MSYTSTSAPWSIPTITDTESEWEVHARYGHGESTAQFDAPLRDVSSYFDSAELEGWSIEMDRKTGNIHAADVPTGRSYRFQRKHSRTPITIKMVDNLVRLDRSAKDHMRIVRTKDGGVRLYGFTVGLTVAQSNALRDKGWVVIVDDKPRVTAVGQWIIDHADEITARLSRGFDLRF